MNEGKTRLERLEELLLERGVERMIVSRLENVRYLTGFAGSNATVVAGGGRPLLLTDARYAEQASMEAPGCEILLFSGDRYASLAKALPARARVAFEESLAYGSYRMLASSVSARAELVGVEGLVEDLRAIKDPEEVEALREAVRCSAAGFAGVTDSIRAGALESEIAAELDYRTRLAGARSPAFDTIVASGPNSSMPHAPVGGRALAEGDPVIVDFGAAFEGYRSDITRTVTVGEPPARVAGAVEAVREALDAALVALEPGVTATSVDAAARRALADRGLEEFFSHGLGHGVGLDEHEKPSLSARSTDVLEPGMVFTIEPGVYFAGEFGTRIEEMVLMTPGGAELLTGSIEGGASRPRTTVD